MCQHPIVHAMRTQKTQKTEIIEIPVLKQTIISSSNYTLSGVILIFTFPGALVYTEVSENSLEEIEAEDQEAYTQLRQPKGK